MTTSIPKTLHEELVAHFDNEIQNITEVVNNMELALTHDRVRLDKLKKLRDGLTTQPELDIQPTK